MPTEVATENSANNEETEDKAEEKPDKMWLALKTHIMRERARNQQREEAKVEEERIRREREQNNVTTLGETRKQIGDIELKIAQLKEEKHLLFRQLKKVLHEDDNRRRQLVKDNDLIPGNMSSIIAPGSIHPSQLYLPNIGGPPTNGAHISNLQPAGNLIGVGPNIYKSIPPGSIKRGRSPSPPNQSSLAHQPQQISSAGLSSYQQQSQGNYDVYKPISQQHFLPQKDDNRRELMRAVLWNKPSQYANPPSMPPGNFYSTINPNERVIYYNTPPISNVPPPPSREISSSREMSSTSVPSGPQILTTNGRNPHPIYESYAHLPSGGSRSSSSQSSGVTVVQPGLPPHLHSSGLTITQTQGTKQVSGYPPPTVRNQSLQYQQYASQPSLSSRPMYSTNPPSGGYPPVTSSSRD